MSTRVISVLLALLLGWMGLAAAHGLAPAQSAPAMAALAVDVDVDVDSGGAEPVTELAAVPAEAAADLPEGFLPAAPAQAQHRATDAPGTHAARLLPAPHIDGPQRPPRPAPSA